MKDSKIKWIDNSQKKAHISMISIGFISCFLTVYFIFYLIIFPNINNVNFGFVLFLIISIMASIISSSIVYNVSLDAFPYYIGLSNTKLFLKNKKGKIISYEFNDIIEMNKRNNDLKIKLKTFKYNLFYRINNQNYNIIFKKFQEFKNNKLK